MDKPDVRDLLMNLKREPKPKNEKWMKVQSYLQEIHEARERGVTWSAIAETLQVGGIDVSAVGLRGYVTKQNRDGKKTSRSNATRVSRSTILRTSKSAKDVNPGLNQRASQPEEDGVPQPLVHANPELQTEKEQHAGPRRKNRRV